MPVIPLNASYANVIGACSGFNAQSSIEEIVNGIKPEVLKQCGLYEKNPLICTNTFYTEMVGFILQVFDGRFPPGLDSQSRLKYINNYILKIGVPFYHTTFVTIETKTTTSFEYRVLPPLEPRMWGKNSRYKPVFGTMIHYDPISEEIMIRTASEPIKTYKAKYVFLDYHDQEYIKQNIIAVPDDNCEYTFDPEKPKNQEKIQNEDSQFTISGKSIINIKFDLNIDTMISLAHEFMDSEWTLNKSDPKTYYKYFSRQGSVYTDLNAEDLIIDLMGNKENFFLDRLKLKDSDLAPREYLRKLINEKALDMLSYQVANPSKLNIEYDKYHSYNDFTIWKKSKMGLIADDAIIKGSTTYTRINNDLIGTTGRRVCKDDCGRESMPRYTNSYIYKTEKITKKILEYKEDPKNKYGIKCKSEDWSKDLT